MAANIDSHEQDDRARLVAELPVSEHKMDLAGISTAVLVGGDGPPMVLLHGPGHSSLWWMRVVPKLVATHRVIVPDLPGHGASDVADGSLDAGRMLAWMEQLVDRTCDGSPVLVGHALGAAIAARFTVQHGGRVAHLVLESALGLGRFFPSPRFAFRLFRFMARPSEATRQRFFRHCMHDQQAVAADVGPLWRPFKADYVDRLRTVERRKALRTLLKEVGAPRIPAAELARIQVPVTLIHGRYDRAVSVKVARAASIRYGWPLYELEAGADPDFEDPQGVLRVLHEQLEQRSSQGEPRTRFVAAVPSP